MKERLFVVLALLAIGLLIVGQPANAQDYSNIRIVRLSFVEGSVQYQRPGEDWQDAGLNLPIQEGFALRTGDGYAEVEFEGSLEIRLGTNSTMEFTSLALLDGSRITRVNFSQGTCIISAKLSRGEAMSVAASNLNIKVPHSGRFRVDVSPTGSWVTVFHGKVEVDSGSETGLVLAGGHTLHEDASGSGSPEIASSPALDAFDKWVSQREEAVSYAREGTSSILNNRNYTEGFADLYNFGSWSNIPGFGMGWMPYGLGASWMPFVSGQWIFMGGTGWNWVSSEPWGWMPYHFGSWINAPGFGWVWLPNGSLWQPATATWVQVNNQLGWIPNAPSKPSKPTRVQQASPATMILATPGASGAITAGGRMALAQGTTTMQVTSAPAPGFAAPVIRGVESVAHSTATTTGSTKAGTFIQSGPVSQARISSGPASLRAPGGAAARPRSAPLSSVPPSLMAPHSTPAPRAIAGASGGFKGGIGGMRGGGDGRGAGVSAGGSAAAPASVSTHGTGMGSASHSSGASAGSSAGHR
jgi:hypothetical protein